MSGSALDLVESIQIMVAPAVMISASALLLLGMNSKYSSVLGRIRGLNDERCKLLKSLKNDNDHRHRQRLEVLSRELTKLFKRSESVRNAALAYYSGIGLFVLTSLCIGLAYYCGWERVERILAYPFIGGMLCVLTGAIFGIREVLYGYNILQLEVFGLAPRFVPKEESLTFYEGEDLRRVATSEPS